MEEVVHPLHAADVLDEMESRIVHIEDLAMVSGRRLGRMVLVELGLVSMLVAVVLLFLIR